MNLLTKSTYFNNYYFKKMSCSCGSQDFQLHDECFLVCQKCGQQIHETANDHEEFEAYRYGHTRFGFGVFSNVSLASDDGEIMLDVTMNFEAPTKTSLGSAYMDKNTFKYYQKIRRDLQIQQILKKLVDPLDHPMDVKERVRRASEKMISQLYFDEHDPMKNRGLRKNAIFALIVKRMILHFIPEYDERKYNELVLIPFFKNSDLKVIQRYISKYGIPVFKQNFEQVDQSYDQDLLIHLKCKVRRLYDHLYENGQYFSTNNQIGERVRRQCVNFIGHLFNFAGEIIFNPIVVAHLQSWDLFTRIGVITCFLRLSTSEEIVEFVSHLEGHCVKSTTIQSKLNLPVVKNVFQNIFENNLQSKQYYEYYYSLLNV